MCPQQTGSHSQSIPLCNSLEAASPSSSCCSLVSSSSLEVSWASRPPRYSWPPCPFRTHGPPLGLLNVEGFHMMTFHHGETDDKQDDIDNTIYHGYMQDDNTGQKMRRNKLVVIVIDGWVNSIHQLFLRRKINKEIDFKAKRLIFTLLLLIDSKLNLGFVGTTLTSTTRRPGASWSASRSSWKPAFAPSTSSPSSQQSPSPPGKQYKPVCFVVKKKLFWCFLCTGLYPETHGIVGNQFYDREVTFSFPSDDNFCFSSNTCRFTRWCGWESRAAFTPSSTLRTNGRRTTKNGGKRSQTDFWKYLKVH